MFSDTKQGSVLATLLCYRSVLFRFLPIKELEEVSQGFPKDRLRTGYLTATTHSHANTTYCFLEIFMTWSLSLSLTSVRTLKSQNCAQLIFCVAAVGETCERQWEACIRHYPAPWAELAVENLILTVPSDSIRHMEDPRPLLTLWNEIMVAISKLAAVPAKFPRPERIVTDVQISCGRYIAVWRPGLRQGASSSSV